jgi:tRNA dimethylallyltransferase
VRPPLIAVIGPTASGKSQLAMAIAEAFDGEIVNADSRQIYRGLDLLTNKPSASDLSLIPHHLLSILDPGTSFSVAEYQKLALQTIKEIHSRGRLPILVGGTGLYVGSVTEGLKFAAAPDKELRDSLNEMGTSELVTILAQVAPASRVDTKNRIRVIRAIEIARSGIAPSKTEKPFRTLKLGIALTKEALDAKIEQRILNLDTKELVDQIQGHPLDSLSASSLGVSEILAYINHRLTEPELKKQLIRLHRQYAKRQMTWFKRDQEILWVKDSQEALKLTEEFRQQV